MRWRRTVAVSVSEALVAAVDTVVHAVADVGRVDALAARQAVKRAVDGRRHRAGHPPSVVHTAAAAAVARAHLVGRRLPSISD